MGVTLCDHKARGIVLLQESEVETDYVHFFEGDKGATDTIRALQGLAGDKAGLQ